MSKQFHIKVSREIGSFRKSGDANTKQMYKQMENYSLFIEKSRALLNAFFGFKILSKNLNFYDFSRKYQKEYFTVLYIHLYSPAKICKAGSFFAYE
jgi:hypothetical protein